MTGQISKTHPRTRLARLEFDVFRALLHMDYRNRKLLVACSGGVDSVALLNILAQIAPRLGVQVIVAHIHHGRSLNPESRHFRDRALELVQVQAQALGLVFHSVCRSVEQSPLMSEAKLRDFRLRSLKEIFDLEKCDDIAFAHHKDDLLETRLIRILRGTSVRGLEAMSMRKGKVLRPLLTHGREQIVAYAKEKNLKWIEDPSNATDETLRNWIRIQLLPLLESKRRGSVKAMARSLESVVEMSSTEASDRPLGFLKKIVIDRVKLEALSPSEAKLVFGDTFLQLGLRDFTAGHIDEILKRLKSKRLTQEFTLLGTAWSINAEQVKIERSSRF